MDNDISRLTVFFKTVLAFLNSVIVTNEETPQGLLLLLFIIIIIITPSVVYGGCDNWTG